MTTFIKYKQTWQAKITTRGTVEVQQVTSDHIEGSVYFRCKTHAFNIATELLRLGLICPKRKGYMITPKGYLATNGGYILGAVLLATRDKKTLVYTDEVAKSKMIHEACQARS